METLSLGLDPETNHLPVSEAEILESWDSGNQPAGVLVAGEPLGSDSQLELRKLLRF